MRNKACGLLFFILTTSFVTGLSLAIGPQSSWAKESKSGQHEANKIYITRKAIVQISPQKLAIWQGKSLIEIATLHADDQGMFVYTKELGECLAKHISCSLRDNAGSSQQNTCPKGFSSRPSWICGVCQLAFWTRDDLYDHIYKAHGPHAYDGGTIYDD